jgi:ABC-type Zn uptake system ZnuABC Zn-binding protein ZnuA
MKKLIGSLMVVLVLICFTSVSFAASKSGKPSQEPTVVSTESSNTIMGKIVSLDKAKNEIVVKDGETKTNKTIMVEAQDIKMLKKGLLVKIVLAPGSTDKAGAVEIVKPTPGKKEEKKQ